MARDEYASIERELHIDASPEVVFEVVSRPEHIRQWWSDEAQFAPAVGGTGTLTFGQPGAPDAHVVPLTVVASDPPRSFTFRWDHPADEPAATANSLLVTFDLAPAGTGTRLRLTETGFRERGWELATLEQHYAEHSTGWDHFLPRLADYAPRPVATR